MAILQEVPSDTDNQRRTFLLVIESFSDAEDVDGFATDVQAAVRGMLDGGAIVRPVSTYMEA